MLMVAVNTTVYSMCDFANTRPPRP